MGLLSMEERARLVGGRFELVAATEGFGHHRRIHSAHFFELADQPVEVIMAVTAAESAGFHDASRAIMMPAFHRDAVARRASARMTDASRLTTSATPSNMTTVTTSAGL